jgi:hypothetical protein
MKNGAMQKIIASSPEERIAADKLRNMDDVILHFRALIRKGEQISTEQIVKLII